MKILLADAFDASLPDALKKYGGGDRGCHAVARG